MTIDVINVAKKFYSEKAKAAKQVKIDQEKINEKFNINNKQLNSNWKAFDNKLQDYIKEGLNDEDMELPLISLNDLSIKFNFIDIDKNINSLFSDLVKEKRLNINLNHHNTFYAASKRERMYKEAKRQAYSYLQSRAMALVCEHLNQIKYLKADVDQGIIKAKITLPAKQLNKIKNSNL